MKRVWITVLYTLFSSFLVFFPIAHTCNRNCISFFPPLFLRPKFWCKIVVPFSDLWWFLEMLLLSLMPFSWVTLSRMLFFCGYISGLLLGSLEGKKPKVFMDKDRPFTLFLTLSFIISISWCKSSNLFASYSTHPFLRTGIAYCNTMGCISFL